MQNSPGNSKGRRSAGAVGTSPHHGKQGRSSDREGCRETEVTNPAHDFPSFRMEENKFSLLI